MAWITGAYGFIGRRLASLIGGGEGVVAGVGYGAWSESEARRHGLSYWLNSEVSAASLEQLRSATRSPDVVFHLAGGSSVGSAIANPREDFRRTVASTADLLEWLRQCSPTTRLVAVSSAAVYGAGYTVRISESDRLAPMSPYGTHKLLMEEICRSYAANYGIRVVIPRPFSVYGPGLRKQLLWDICEKISRGSEVELGGSGEERRDWVHVADVTRILVAFGELAAETAPAVNLASGIATSVREIVTEVVRAWGSMRPGTAVVFNGRSRPGDPRSLIANVERMESWGLAARTPVTQGIDEYVNWYRSAKGPRT
jgi:UDP-glucose 4-epimerase